MMAAVSAKEAHGQADVFLIEKNPSLGRKVIISGGGRCNVTTGYDDLRSIADRYPRGGKFLASALNRFAPVAVRAFFEERGVPLKIEEDLRVFPVSDRGADVVEVFEREFRANETRVLLRHSVLGIERRGDGFTIHFAAHPDLEVDRVIVTTGGQAYRHTGSTGDGYALAESLGHTITSLAPSLNAFVCPEAWVRSLAGVSLPKVRLRAGRSEFTGPMLFTHKGLTGPAVFALSSLIAFENYGKEAPLELFLDFVPEFSGGEWAAALDAEMGEHPSRALKNTLPRWMPRSLAEALCVALGVAGAGDRANREVSKRDRHAVVEWVKRMPVSVTGRSPGDEFVTAGGVSLKEVDSKTMGSKLCPGLFFAGEILDIDGFTGGYNLQAAWCTGHAAGLAAAV